MALSHSLGSLLFFSSLTMAGFGCGSGDGSTADGSAGSPGSAGAAGAPPSSGERLNSAARDDLLAAGADEFLGVAEIMSETTVEDETAITFEPSSGPICVTGTPFTTHIRDKGSEDLIIYLQGGGACWTGFPLCTLEAEQVLLPLAYMDDAIADNPFRDWNVLYVPYCDGSVFSGNNEVDDSDPTFPDGKRYHHGRQNFSAALDVALERLTTPKRIFLSGLSAGGYGTIAATALVRLVYPEADIFVYNDSGPGVQDISDTTNVGYRVDEWKFAEVIPASCTACDNGRGQLTEFVAWMLENDPSLKVGLLSHYQDGVIGGAFLRLGGAAYKTLLLQETGKLNTKYPDRYKRFMIPSSDHVVTGKWPDQAVVDGVSVSDWAAALVSGGSDWRDLLAPDE